MSQSSLSHKDYLKIDRDYASAAKVADLLYVSDTQPGIQRVKLDAGFRYMFKDKEVSDEEQLQRIKKLAIPPAWENVWICPKANGHIQATGFDVRKRKQFFSCCSSLPFPLPS